MDEVLAGLSYLARLYACQGRVKGAHAAAQEVSTVIQSYGVERLSMLAAAHFANVQLYTGQEEAAAQWAAEYQAVRADLSHELADLILLHILLKTNNRGNVLPILNDLLRQAQAQGNVLICIESMIIMAIFHQAEEDASKAVDWLSQALELAAHEGFIRVFLDEGEALLDLLPKARQAAPKLVDTILSIIQAESGKSPLDQLPDPLTEQEQRILNLIAAGKTNQEIADELVISIGTAKWHVHNILQKLGVSNRSHAVARARELGL
jgi:LuxR family maltose regulon positive regulatory protein